MAINAHPVQCLLTQTNAVSPLSLLCIHSDIKTYLNRHTGVICIAEAEIIADLYPDLAKEAITVAVEICFQYNFVTSWTRLKTKYIENSDIFDGQVYEDWLTATESQAIETLSRLDRYERVCFGIS